MLSLGKTVFTEGNRKENMGAKMAKTNKRGKPDLNPIREELDAVIAKGFSPYRVYEDWIGLMFNSFAGEPEAYTKILKYYFQDRPDGDQIEHYFTAALMELMRYMAKTNDEALGPLFMEYAASHYAGQYFTPLELARTMARITQTNIPDNRRFSVHDPACGAGAGLIACAQEQTFEQNNRAFFVGQDIDLNCARMCALNLMFFNLDGLVVWGNTLTKEVRGAWETRRSVAFGGTLRAVDSEQARAFLASHSGTDAKAEKPDQAINKPAIVRENCQFGLF